MMQRSVIIDGYALVLPTTAEIRAFFAGNSDVPIGWENRTPFNSRYWAADISSNGVHRTVNIRDVQSNLIPISDSESLYVFFQVLTAQRTMTVNLPADQQTRYTTTVEVVTFDMDDSITDGSLTAELALIDELDDSLIELGDPFCQ